MPRKTKPQAERYEELLSKSEQEDKRIEAIKRYIQRGGRGRDPAPEVEAADELYAEE